MWILNSFILLLWLHLNRYMDLYRSNMGYVCTLPMDSFDVLISTWLNKILARCYDGINAHMWISLYAHQIEVLRRMLNLREIYSSFEIKRPRIEMVNIFDGTLWSLLYWYLNDGNWRIIWDTNIASTLW